MLVVLVVLILVGLPLLAYWIGGRGIWARLRPGAERDPWREFVRRHGLSSSDALRVAQCVPRGLAVDEPHLRPVAADWAERLLEQETVRWPASRSGRIVAGLLTAWFLGVVGSVVYRVLTGRPEEVNWVMVAFLAGVVAWTVRRRRNLRRAIERNRG